MNSEEDLDTKATWSVAMFYEDAAARERAVKFCDQLMEKFWAEHEFTVSSWSFAELAGAPAQAAVEANLIVFAAGGKAELPINVKAWLQSSINLRGRREGSLIELSPSGAMCGNTGNEEHCYLRNVAHTAGMDYLTEVPQTIQGAPDSPDWYCERAARVSNLLNEIMQRPPPPLLP